MEWISNKIFLFLPYTNFIIFKKKQIIHRDVHFGNLVFDKDKNIILIQYKVSIEYKNISINDIVG